jgi:hypothetical protein
MMRMLLGATNGSGSFAPPPPAAGGLPPQGDPLPGALTKYVSNPVFLPGTSGQWDDREVGGESCYFDEDLGLFVMSYSGTSDSTTWHTGLAYSEDLITWTREATNPVYSAFSHVAPTILRRGAGDYLMYIQNWPGASQIYALSSSDLLTWMSENGGSPVIPILAGQLHTFDPNARIRSDGTIELFHGLWESSGLRSIQTALSADGITFTDRRFLFTYEAGEWSEQLGAPAVLASSDTEYSIFHDANASGASRWINRHRTVDDGAAFEYEQHVLDHSGFGWDSAAVFDSCPIWLDGVLYLLYSGGVGGEPVGINMRIGLATVDWAI